MLEHKLPAVGFEDCFCVAILGHKAFNFVPEGFLMIAEPEMGKFVDDDVLGNDFGGKEDAGVDDDAVFGSAAPPLAFLKPDAEPGRGNLCEGSILQDDLFQRSCADSPIQQDDQIAGNGCLIGFSKAVGDGDEKLVAGKFCFCRAAGFADNGVLPTEKGKGFPVGVTADDLGTGGVFLYLIRDPFTLGFDEFSDFFGRDALRHTDDDRGIGFDLHSP